MSNCDACKEIKKTEPVPYIVHESAQARNERTVKRLVVALIVAIALIFASNAIWLYAWMQYDYSSDMTTSEEINVDGKDGIANYIGNDGDIVNGGE
jgi:flagellar biogenesis protein FliO